MPGNTLHDTTFEYLKPTDEQVKKMGQLRAATAMYANTLDASLPAGPDKDYVLRELRSLAMWVNVCVTRDETGKPRP
jgi:hypothetical protein